MKFKLIICLSLLFISAGAFGQSKSVYEKAVDSFNQKGEEEKIIPYLEAELKKQPKNENLLRLMGYQYLQLKNNEFGEKYYREALVVNPACGRCYLNIGRIYAQRNDFKQALIYLDKAVIADPKDELLLSNRAKIEEMSGDKFGALADHNRAVALAPKNADSYTERGIYNLNQTYNALALADFNKAITLNPNSSYPYFYLSKIKYENNDLEDALKSINQAILLDDKQGMLFNFRGNIYTALKQYESALENYSAAIKLHPDDFSSYLSRAGAYYGLENMDAACEDYTIAKKLVSKQKTISPELLKNIDASILDLCDATKASYFYQRGVAFYNLKQYDKALEIYKMGLQKFPKNAMILSFLGNAYLALKDYQNASINYESALANKSNLMTELANNIRYSNSSEQDRLSFYKASLASIYYNIAECHIYNEKFDEALNAMDEAISLAPNIAGFTKETYYNRRGNIYLEINKYDLAQADFSQSINMNQNYAPAYISRAIAKISVIENVKKSDAIISAKLPYQPFRTNWGIKSKKSSKNSEPSIISALEDCNKGIGLDENNGFAYYIRGQIKSFLGYPDYCIDLIKAKKMGVEVEASLLAGCN
ncbi:tetratricopeptide repeat protein [Pedobacter changchengzhani]|uniref:Tetratricopeptide repeat protein n=1 Tax=Pedobacter changchengzhani TaxID=2529274 RepID=A0A4R5MKY3_9SPHI|nr:tetratricopeptide repeat protein [Pedobacter changchengzhani]TDG36397.1 tetratricopeptide repeat protein [Pedobacter changchengzhani]